MAILPEKTVIGLPDRSTVIGLTACSKMADASDAVGNQCCKLHSLALVKKTSTRLAPNTFYLTDP